MAPCSQAPRMGRPQPRGGYGNARDVSFSSGWPAIRSAGCASSLAAPGEAESVAGIPRRRVSSVDSSCRSPDLSIETSHARPRGQPGDDWRWRRGECSARDNAEPVRARQTAAWNRRPSFCGRPREVERTDPLLQSANEDSDDPDSTRVCVVVCRERVFPGYARETETRVSPRSIVDRSDAARLR